jgi:hypothetical protein
MSLSLQNIYFLNNRHADYKHDSTIAQVTFDMSIANMEADYNRDVKTAKQKFNYSQEDNNDYNLATTLNGVKFAYDRSLAAAVQTFDKAMNSLNFRYSSDYTEMVNNSNNSLSKEDDSRIEAYFNDLDNLKFIHTIEELLHMTSEVKETKPAEVKETKPAEVKETKPAEVKETKPAEVKETKPAEVKETKPTEVKETKPTEVKETKPTEVKETKPTEVKETKPTEVKEKTLGKATIREISQEAEKRASKYLPDKPASVSWADMTYSQDSNKQTLVKPVFKSKRDSWTAVKPKVKNSSISNLTDAWIPLSFTCAGLNGYNVEQVDSILNANPIVSLYNNGKFTYCDLNFTGNPNDPQKSSYEIKPRCTLKDLNGTFDIVGKGGSWKGTHGKVYYNDASPFFYLYRYANGVVSVAIPLDSEGDAFYNNNSKYKDIKEVKKYLDLTRSFNTITLDVKLM